MDFRNVSVRSALWLGTVLLVMSGCSTLEQTNRGFVDKIGTYPLTQRNEVEMLDLAHIVVEHIGRGHHPADVSKCQLSFYSAEKAKADEASATPGRRLDEALGCFAQLVERDRSRAERARNQIQERMLAASEQRCADFKMYLQRTQAVANFASGSLTSLFAAAGAITKSIEGAKTFAGLSGLSSAVGAEYSQAYFASLAAHVIISGIDRQRARIYEQIYASGQSQPIDKYTLQAAIRDAFRFHGSCALTSGLIEAQDAIRVADNPGMDALSRAIVKNKHLQDLTNAKPSEVAAVVDKWKDLLPPDRWLAGVPLVTTTRPFPNEAAQAANLLAGHHAQSAAVKKLVKDDADALTKKKPALMKDGTSANKYASGVVDQVGATGLATQKLLTLCTAPVIATAGKAIGLIASRAAMGEGIARDKLDVDINYVKAEKNLQIATMTTYDANLDRCVAQAQSAISTIGELADTAATDAVDTVLKKLGTTLTACDSAKAQKAAAACPLVAAK